MTPRGASGPFGSDFPAGRAISSAATGCEIVGLEGDQHAHELEFRATSFATLVQVAAGGGAVTLLPELAVNVEARGLKLRNFADPAPHRTIVLAWRKSSPLRDALRKIGATLRSAAGVQ